MATVTFELCTLARAVFTWAVKSHNISRREYDWLMRQVIASERRLIGCESKEQFIKYSLAETVAKLRNRRRQDKNEPPFIVYGCAICHHFHIAAVDHEARVAEEWRRRRLANQAEVSSA